MPRCPPLFIIATLRFRSASLSSSLEESAEVLLCFAFFIGRGGEEEETGPGGRTGGHIVHEYQQFRHFE